MFTEEQKKHFREKLEKILSAPKGTMVVMSMFDGDTISAAAKGIKPSELDIFLHETKEALL